MDSLIGNVLATESSGPATPATTTPAIPNKSLTTDPAAGAVAADGALYSVPVTELEPNPFQPRGSISPDSIARLAQSISQRGLLQPIVARRRGNRLQIIAGERRWRAGQQLGMSEVPVLIRQATDEQMLELAIIENIQREDLNAIERARAYRQYCDRFGLSAEQVAARVAEDRTTVTNYLRLLELSEPLQLLVREGKLSMGHARCLLGVPDGQRRWQLAEAVVKSDLSVRALEELARQEKKAAASPGAGATDRDRARSLHLRDLQRRFEEALKTKVTIHEGRRKGTGRIVIQYFSVADFDRIAERLGVRLD